MLKALPIVIKHFPTGLPSAPRPSDVTIDYPMPGPDYNVVQAEAAIRQEAIDARRPSQAPPWTAASPLMQALRASQAEEIGGVSDGALRVAIANANVNIQRGAQEMAGDPLPTILKKLAAMLRAWQEELKGSLPALGAAR
jgi:hypothetical protein